MCCQSEEASMHPRTHIHQKPENVAAPPHIPSCAPRFNHVHKIANRYTGSVTMSHGHGDTACV